ncbi:MAG: hypothetical protein QE510_04505 [Verrucomicrobiota bacterium]|nr:hypothetical protein [Verrucomicrobiota bacterium]
MRRLVDSVNFRHWRGARVTRLDLPRVSMPLGVLLGILASGRAMADRAPIGSAEAPSRDCR